VLSPHILRINAGGHQSTNLLMQLLHLSYPQHSSIISYNVSERLKEKYIYVAQDYRAELHKWEDIINKNKTDKSYHDPSINVTTILLPDTLHRSDAPYVEDYKSSSILNNSNTNSAGTGVGVERRDQVREDRIHRMRQMVQKRKEQAIKEKQDFITQAEKILQTKETDMQSFMGSLETMGKTEKEIIRELQKAKEFLKEKESSAEQQQQQQQSQPQSQQPQKKKNDPNKIEDFDNLQKREYIE
jgi:hypothetical protein